MSLWDKVYVIVECSNSRKSDAQESLGILCEPEVTKDKP